MEVIFNYISPQMMIDILTSILKQRKCTTALKLQSSYIMVNIAAAKSEIRNLLSSCEIIILDASNNLRSTDHELVLASLWLLINLSWDLKENSDRKICLSNYGIVEIVKELTTNNVVPEIRDRANTLLKNFN